MSAFFVPSLGAGSPPLYSGDDQSDDNFNGGAAGSFAGAQPELAVVDIVHDEPTGTAGTARTRCVAPRVETTNDTCLAARRA